MAPTKSKKLSDPEYLKLFDRAFAAARVATDRYLREYPDAWFPCGFAWVRFDGRDPAVKFIKKNFPDRGHKAYPTGWEIWNPSGNHTQCMDAKLAGAEAFARVLSDGGVKCYADSRMD